MSQDLYPIFARGRFAPTISSEDRGNDVTGDVDPKTPVLPKDHYLHPTAATEWWWNVGTLVTKDGRTFGFEINAASFQKFGFTQVMLTDVETGTHLQSTVRYLSGEGGFDPLTWAQSDWRKDWSVSLGQVTMHAPQGDPTKQITVKAEMSDEATKKNVVFDLMLSQEGPPLLVWGKGYADLPDGEGTNYYYSLTRLQASGSIIIEGNEYEVEGVTWMDHEYGDFGTPGQQVKWVLQDIQLPGGVSITNQAFGPPSLDNPVTLSVATLMQEGASRFVLSRTTPITNTETGLKPTWTSPVTGNTYFMAWKIELFDLGKPPTTLVVSSLVAGQEFPVSGGPIYEGVAIAKGTFQGEENVTGTAWNEQSL